MPKKWYEENIMGKNEIFLESLREHLSNAGTPPRQKSLRHSKRLFKRISPLGVLLLSVAIGIGMLTGLLYTTFTVTMTGPVELTGTMHPLFSFDATEFDTPYLNISADLTELNSGETKTFPHHIINMDAGAWFVDVDLSACQYFYCEPEHEFYGLNVSVDNWMIDGEPTTDLLVAPGEDISFDLVWSLHHEFVTAEDPFPSNIVITLIRANEPPTAVDDNAGTIEHGQIVILDAVANDYDLEDDDLTIISVDNPNPSAFSVTITPDNKLEIFNAYGVVGNHVFTFTYTINDGHPGNDATATVTVTLHWSG